MRNTAIEKATAAADDPAGAEVPDVAPNPPEDEDAWDEDAEEEAGEDDAEVAGK